MSNCKIGDLAIVIGKSSIAGRIVEVIGPCPRNTPFCLPDGFPHEPVDYEWIVRLQNPVEARLDNGTTRTTVYAPVPDRVLRPVSGLPIDEDVKDEVTA